MSYLDTIKSQIGQGRLPCPTLFKIHLVAIDVATELAADLAVGFVDDGLHGFVVREHLGGEPANAVAPRENFVPSACYFSCPLVR